MLVGEIQTKHHRIWAPAVLPVLFVVPLLSCENEGASDAQRAALERVAARPDWLLPSDDCPADVVPERDDARVVADLCLPRLLNCLSGCEDGDDTLCQSAALAVQDLGDPDGAEALFLRACRLGNMSGCTNRAAGILTYGSGEEEGLRCATRTFEKTCEAGDPWGCTMLGLHLVRGIGIDPDYERAQNVLRLACEVDETDPACAAARETASQIPTKDPN